MPLMSLDMPYLSPSDNLVFSLYQPTIAMLLLTVHSMLTSCLVKPSVVESSGRKNVYTGAGSGTSAKNIIITITKIFQYFSVEYLKNKQLFSLVRSFRFNVTNLIFCYSNCYCFIIFNNTVILYFYFDIKPIKRTAYSNR